MPKLCPIYWPRYMCEILGDRDPRLRAEAAETLGILGDERGITPLRECLGDEGDPDLPKFGGQRVCDIAAEALRRIGTEAATLAVEAWDVPPMEPRYELGYFLWGE
jgi:HEAT repeat protein